LAEISDQLRPGSPGKRRSRITPGALALLAAAARGVCGTRCLFSISRDPLERVVEEEGCGQILALVDRELLEGVYSPPVPRATGAPQSRRFSKLLDGGEDRVTS